MKSDWIFPGIFQHRKDDSWKRLAGCLLKPQKTRPPKKAPASGLGMILFSVRGRSRWRERLTVRGSRVDVFFFSYKERLTETVRKIEVQR